jgi:thiol-disulfide isomerase/thioredoxin
MIHRHRAPWMRNTLVLWSVLRFSGFFEPRRSQMELQRRMGSSSGGLSAPARQTDERAETLDLGRRRLLGAVALTFAGAQVGDLGATQAGESQGLAGLVQATEWINSPPLSTATLAGKVVLTNFWTYTCINWLRTLPHIRAWSKKYSGRLVVIGVHTPEFPFERVPQNVRRAVRERKIDYPVAIDNDRAIWRAFGNTYWPAIYLIDGHGRIRHQRFGEGEYQQSELTISRVLAEAGTGRAGEGLVSVEGAGVEAAADWDNLRSAETYLGHDRTEGFASPGGAVPDRRRAYLAPARLALNQWALSGEWTIFAEMVAPSAERARISYRFHARDLHMVMSPSGASSAVPFRVSIDGQPPGTARGVDVDVGGNGAVVEQRLYQLIRQSRPIVNRTFEIEFASAGVEIFAITFG